MSLPDPTAQRPKRTVGSCFFNSSFVIIALIQAQMIALSFNDLLRMPALLVLLGCLPDRLAAQSDTSRLLPTVLVRDASLEKTGFSTWKADSLPVVTTLSLSERLALENPLAVRANAPGTLATLSARGLGPSHTPVFWQGFNLQSLQNGVVDVDFIPFRLMMKLPSRRTKRSAQ